MEFLTLIVVFYVVSRIFEGIRKAGQPPPQGRPGAGGRMPSGAAGRPGRPGPSQQPQGRSAGDEQAAGMVPDELWEMLTGQPRPRPAPPEPSPGPVPVLVDERPDWEIEDEEEEAAERRHQEERMAAQPVRDEAAEVEALLRRQREAAQRRPPATPVVRRARMAEPLPDRARHRAFHQKIDAAAPAAPVTPALAARMGLAGNHDLRRAVILREVLGRPKGME